MLNMFQRTINKSTEGVSWILPFNIPKLGQKTDGQPGEQTGGQMDGNNQENQEKKSFMQMWNDHTERKKNDGSTAKTAQLGMRLIMVFQAPTMIYVFMYHLVPHFFADYNPWVQYYMKVICWFILINGMTNYLCVILYDPTFKKSKDNPYMSISKKWDNPPDQFIPQLDYLNANGDGKTNGHCVYDMSTKEGLPWDYCNLCDMNVPPRTHHCKFCNKCILKRDHHCFMVGNCIGFKNQRFFIVLAFYAMVTGGLGAYFTITYVHELVWPELDSWTDLIPYVAIWKGLFGTMSGLHAVLVIHCLLEPVFGLVGFVYFTSQMTIATQGKTLFEVSKNVPIKNLNSYNRNLKSVFGDFWALNFLFPMVLIFRQTDDGVHWENVKIDHTAHKRWKDDGEIL